MSTYPDRSRAQKELETGEAVTVSCTLTGLTPGAEILIETLDREHGWALPLWLDMGAPEPPTREETARLIEHANATDRRTVTADAQGTLTLQLSVCPWNVIGIYEQ